MLRSVHTTIGPVSKRRRAGLLAIGVGLVVWLALPALAPAANPPAVYSDPAGDSGQAPDVQKVTLTDNGDGTVAVAIDLAAAIPDDGSLVAFLIDGDRNPRTGDKSGVDYVVYANGKGAGFLRWDSTTGSLQPFDTASLDPDLHGGHLTFTLTLTDLGSPTAFDFRVIAGNAGNTNNDAAPDNGNFTYPQSAAKPTIRSIMIGLTKLLPKAGKVLAIPGVNLRLSNNTFVSADSLACTLSYKGVPLHPIGRCTWRIPKSDRQKLLTLKLVAGYQGATTSLSLPVTPS